MKKHLSLILFSSVIAMILCGCTPAQNETSGSENSTSNADTSQVQEDAENASDVSSEDNSETGSDSKTSDNKQSSKPSSASADTSKDTSKNADTDTSAEGSNTEDDDGVLYNEDGQIIETPSKYISTTQMMVDIADKPLADNKTAPFVALIKTKDEFDKIYNDNKEKYSFDKTDSGNDFKTVTDGMDKGFFEMYNAVFIIQPFNKDTGLEVGDTYRENNNVVIDVYRDEPPSADKTSYQLNIICYEKDDIEKLPDLKFFKAGTLFSDEQDDDVIVELGDEQEEESSEEEEDADDGPLYIITDEDDNFYLASEGEDS